MTSNLCLRVGTTAGTATSGEPRPCATLGPMSYASALRGAFEGVTTTFREEVSRNQRLDSWVNAIVGLGGSRDKRTSTYVAPLQTLTVTDLENLYHGNDLAARMVDALVEDALREGFAVDGESEGDLFEALDRWDAHSLLSDAATWGRLYGAGALLIGTVDALGAMDSELDLDRVGPDHLLYLLPLDRGNLSVADRVSDPDSPDFGQPRIYQISYDSGDIAPALESSRFSLSGSTSGERSSRAASSLVHASRLIMFGGARTAPRVKRGHGEGFDLSVLQRPWNILRDAGTSWDSVMLMLHDLSQAVFKMQGLTDMIAEGQKDVVLQRMEVVDMARSIARAVVIDAEAEDFEHIGAANVAGVEPIVMMAFHRLASAAKMPLTKLIGMSPGGMNATGESDTRNWYDEVGSYQKKITGQVEAVVRLIAAHEGIATDGNVTWPSLWQETPAEEEERLSKRATRHKTWIDSGVLEPEAVAIAEFEEDPVYGEILDFAELRAALAEPDPEPPPIQIMPPAPEPEPEPEPELDADDD